MTAETSNARGELRMTDIREDAREPLQLLRDRLADDEISWRALCRLMPMLAAPPPAAARGDVRGLVARVAQLREAIESEPDHCFGANVIGGRAYGVRENLLCIVGLIEAALAAEGVQAGEVEQALIGAAFLTVLRDPSVAWRDKREAAEFIRRVAETAAEQNPTFKAEAGKVAEYQYRCPKAFDSSWRRMSKGEYDATLATGHACGNPGWTRDVEVRALYTASALSQQPEARVYQCPRCATSMEVDPTAKPEARGVVAAGVYHRLRSIRYNATHGSQDRPLHMRLRLIAEDAQRAIDAYESAPTRPEARGVVGELVEVGDDESGQPRLLIHTTRDAIRAANLIPFSQVEVRNG